MKKNKKQRSSLKQKFQNLKPVQKVVTVALSLAVLFAISVNIIKVIGISIQDNNQQIKKQSTVINSEGAGTELTITNPENILDIDFGPSVENEDEGNEKKDDEQQK